MKIVVSFSSENHLLKIINYTMQDNAGRDHHGKLEGGVK